MKKKYIIIAVLAIIAVLGTALVTSVTVLKPDNPGIGSPPLTSTHPTKVATRQSTFITVNFSLKKIADIIIKNAGAVYRSIAATDRVVYFIQEK